jgi:N-acetylneuraminic acid mutarotase
MVRRLIMREEALALRNQPPGHKICMKSELQLIIMSISLLALLSGCGVDGGSPPESNTWTWISGSKTESQQGVYGTKGKAAPSNVPGARGSAVSWLDSSGKLWLFGGTGWVDDFYTTEFNDLWKFDPITVEWTWVSGGKNEYQAGVYGTQGTASPSNVPGSRKSAVSWVDSDDNLWLFGGSGMGQLNDLWKFDPVTLEWTWISGSNNVCQAGIYGTRGTSSPSNVPGARIAAVSWIDSGDKLWLFGGDGYDSAGVYGYLNDLWKFDPITVEWTWVSGSDIEWQAGVYGIMGTAAPSNVPGARSDAVSWVDAGGKFWLFGGYGIDSAGNGGFLNDLWKYDPTTFEWTWVSGGSTEGLQGIYGTKGTAALSNIPGGRFDALSWIADDGKLWLFGGAGKDSAGNGGFLNDLWKYDPSTLEWTWISGSNNVSQAGIYGTRGTSSPSNVPGSRESAVSWIAADGKLWLFGGNGRDSAGNWGGYLNDLWHFVP